MPPRNQFHPEVIAQRERAEAEAAAAAKKKYEEQQELLKQVMAKNRIVYFNCGKPRSEKYPDLREPNPLQKQLLDAWLDEKYKVFTYMGANRIGKCQSFQTLIETVDGEIPVGELYVRGKPFYVYAWDGARKVVAKAGIPIKKDGLHQCYRIELSNGKWCEPADFHRVLTSLGWRSVHLIYLASLCLRESSLDIYPSVLPSGVLHWSEKQLDYLDRYFEGFRQCDEPPLISAESDQVFLPSQVCVQPLDAASLRWGGLGGRRTSTPQSECVHLSIQDGLPLSVGQCADSVCHTCGKTSLPSCEVSPLQLQLHVASPSALPLAASTDPRQLFSDAPCLTSSFCMGSNHINSITPISTMQEVYDFEVETHHNYFSAGLVHHNTTIGSILAISTLYGEWPWNGVKIAFSHNQPRRVAYVGQGWETHIKSVIIPSLKFWWPEFMPLKTRKNNQGVDATWEYWSRSHDKGLQGELMIFSTSQDVTVFEGAQYDLVIYDEPPPRDIRVACARGLVDRQGRELFCCTLLNQAWIHREIIRATDERGEPDASYFNISGEASANIGFGITQEGIDQFAKTLTAEEFQARIMGKPSYLSTLVCPRFDRKMHIKDRFQIPLNALIDISIDWHPSKPLMVVFMATLSNGVKYVCDEISFRGNIRAASEEIVRVIRMRDYARVNRIIIDPLSKSGQPNDSDAFSVMEEVLMPYGYSLEVASKEKENGIELLNNMLWTQNECPALYFFRDCKQTIQEVEDLMYDENGKPVKVNDDAFECLYRLCLLDTQWFDEWKPKVSGSARSVIL